MVHAYKYNGWLYRTWEYPTIIEINDDYTVLSLIKTRVLSSEENSIRCFSSWMYKDTFWFISNKEWFNFILTVEDEGNRLYINLSSPYIFEEGAIKYYDFDLDFKINAHQQWREVDINEFLENSKKYNYPPNLVDIIRDVEEKLSKKIKNHYFDKFISKKYSNELIKKQYRISKGSK